MDAPASPGRPDTALSIYYALGANVAIAAMKLVGALFTGSGALLAEAFHSVADTGNEALLLLGRKQARAPPSARHPLGHGRATYFWSFVVTLLLFSLGGVLSIYEGIYKLRNPAVIELPWLAVSIIVLSMLAEGLSLRVALKEIAKARGSITLWRWFRETRHSELIVVLGEDVAAVCGLTVALAAVCMSVVTENSLYDAIGSMLIGVVLIGVASGLAIEIKSLLIGESASPRTRRAIRRALNEREDIVEVVKLVTMQHGEYLVVAIQARLKSSLDAAAMMRSIDDCKHALAERFPQIWWIFFEPVPSSGDRSERRTLRPRRLAHLAPSPRRRRDASIVES